MAQLRLLSLQTSVTVCTAKLKTGHMCFGSLSKNRGEQSSDITVYTRNGPVEAKHIEHRCNRCHSGYTQVLYIS